jgi:hypothetical protein
MRAGSANAQLREAWSSAADDGVRRIAAWQAPRAELARLLEADYCAALRKNLSRREVAAVLRRAKRLWPGIDREIAKVAPVSQFAKLAERLGIRLQTSEDLGPVGMALRGFYVDATSLGARRPVIYLNTAHHPAAVATAWLHEMGHHLTRNLVGGGSRGVHFLVDAGYDEHLSDRVELAADVIVAAVTLPSGDVRRLFGSAAKIRRLATGVFDEAAAETIFSYVRDRVGMEPGGPSRRARLRRRYSPEVIHYTKLRCAMLAEYAT